MTATAAPQGTPGSEGGGASALRFTPLTAASPAQRAAFFAIYHEALPPSERKADDDILVQAERDDGVLELAELDGVAVGFLILYRARAQPIALLEYLGVAANARSGGLGAQLFARIAELSAGRTLLIEVETDRETDAPDIDQRIRRKRFYARQGCRQLAHLAYVMPPVGPQAPPPMDLLVLTDRALVERTTLQAWLDDIYRHVYDQRQDDPMIARMTDGLPDQLAFQPI
ncbi:MAG TPA: GNAT family N-acetyltransferase [Sphingobium sp.]|nr:GNAT family N-acetyltransferase [Sphingobium sp.]